MLRRYPEGITKNKKNIAVLLRFLKISQKKLIKRQRTIKLTMKTLLTNNINVTKLVSAVIILIMKKHLILAKRPERLLYFRKKLRFGQNLNYSRPGLITSETKMRNRFLTQKLLAWDLSSFHWNKKVTGFKSLRVNYWEINQVTPKCKVDFSRYKVAKVNITIEFYIFEIV